MKPEIKKENVTPLFESKFIKVYDLELEEGRHYYDATRRNKEDLVATKSEEEFKKMLPDAVSCVVILNQKDTQPQLLLSHEFRYPAGQFLLSVPAGLIDKEDKELENPLFITAKRELKEETGIDFKDGDEIEVINPFLFSTPGMTDESNALIKIVINQEEIPSLSQEGAVGSECFDGFSLLTKEEAVKILKSGVDKYGIFYSVYTWAALVYFVTDMWK
ncbi:MAG: NUDIX hydrolase [Lachnospiraceae bacterium]|nr:NUDIX hydrolase [Lachnospiraceae bacterium]